MIARIETLGHKSQLGKRHSNNSQLQWSNPGVTRMGAGGIL